MTHEIDLSRFPRFTLLDAEPTPIQPLDNLNRKLADADRRVRIFVKRDDLIPVGGGGNKLRKLEFLIGDAIARGRRHDLDLRRPPVEPRAPDGGGRGAGRARLQARAAAGGAARRRSDYDGNGNVLLDGLFGATIHDVAGTDDAPAFAEARAAALRQQGKHPYIAPSGGSSAVGCLGYVGCSSEIALQSAHHGRWRSTGSSSPAVATARRPASSPPRSDGQRSGAGDILHRAGAARGGAGRGAGEGAGDRGAARPDPGDFAGDDRDRRRPSRRGLRHPDRRHARGGAADGAHRGGCCSIPSTAARPSPACCTTSVPAPMPTARRCCSS